MYPWRLLYCALPETNKFEQVNTNSINLSQQGKKPLRLATKISWYTPVETGTSSQ